MECRTYRTAEGPVPIWGEPQDLTTGAPTVLVVTGAFAKPDSCRRWRAALGRPLLIADLPGNHSPWLAAQTPQAYSRAIGEVAADLGRPMVLCGVSTGGLVALGAHAPNLAWTLALDPLLSNTEMGFLWPAFEQERQRAPSPQMDAFLEAFFGLGPDGAVRRAEHHQVLRGRRTPAWIAIADKVGDNPGIVSEADHAAVRSANGVRSTFVQGVGHQMTYGAASFVMDTLRKLLDEAGS